MDYESKNNIENKEKGILTSDRVHLNEAGNQFLADTMWEVIKKL
jgi:lysophospholipase L1-like esterase